MTGEAPELRARYLETVKTARYYLAGEHPAVARHLCFAFHGYGQLASRFLRQFEGNVPDGVCVVAPEALNRFYTAPLSRDGSHLERVGATWLTREDRDNEIADAIRWLDLVHDDVLREATGATPIITVLGFSQGVATAMRWISQGSVRFRNFVVWSGSLAADLNLEDFRRLIAGINVIVVAGTKDEMMPTEQVSQLQLQLTNAGIPHSLRTHEGGHRLQPPLLGSLLQELADTHVR